MFYFVKKINLSQKFIKRIQSFFYIQSTIAKVELHTIFISDPCRLL